MSKIKSAIQKIKAKKTFITISICAIIISSLGFYYPGFFNTKAAGGVPQIDKIETESPLSLTYQPTQPNPETFSENFASSLSEDIWYRQLNGDNANDIYSGSGTATTYAVSTGSYSYAKASTNNMFNLTSAAKPLYAEIEVKINEENVTGDDYTVSFTMGDGGNGMDISVGGLFGVGYDLNDGVIPGGSHGNINGVVPAIGQKVKLRMEIKEELGQAYAKFMVNYDPDTDNIFEYESVWVPFTMWSNLTRLDFGVNVNQTGNLQAIWSSLDTNFPLPDIPEGYNFARTGMTLDGVPYMDDISDLSGNPSPDIGVLWTGSQSMVVLPDLISDADMRAQFIGGTDLKDVYAYLTTIRMGGTYLATIYDVKTPEEFAQMVIGQFAGAFTVDGYAKVFDAPDGGVDCSGPDYCPVNLDAPIPSVGRIEYAPPATLSSCSPIILDSGATSTPTLEYDLLGSNTYQISYVDLYYNYNSQGNLEDSSHRFTNVFLTPNGNGGYDVAMASSIPAEFGIDGLRNIDALLIATNEHGPVVAYVVHEDKPDLITAIENERLGSIVADIESIFLAGGTSNSDYIWNLDDALVNSTTCYSAPGGNILPPGDGESEPEPVTPPSAYTIPPPVVTPPEIPSEIGEEIPVPVVPQICSNTLAQVQASPIPEFPASWGVGYPWGGRVGWALEHRKNIFNLYVSLLKRQPCSTEVNWILQHDKDINNIRYNILISDEYRTKNQ